MWPFLSFLAWVTVVVLAIGTALKLGAWGRRAFLATVGPKQGDATAAERAARLDRWALRLLAVGLVMLVIVVVTGFAGSYLLRAA